MNLFRIHRLPLFNAPDVDPGAATPQPDPAVVAQVDPANPPPQPEPAPQPDPAVSADPPAADPAPQPHEHGNKGKKPWFLDRISELTHRAQTVEQERDQYKTMLERLQAPSNSDPAAPRQPAQPPAADDSAVEARAQQLLAQRQIQSVISAGLSKFTDWNDRAQVLGAAGAASPDFVMDVIGVAGAEAHVLLHQLSNEPDKAARLAQMDQRARLIELARMSAPQTAATAPPPAAPARQVSKAPPPPPAIEPGSAQGVDWRDDKTSDADFSRAWDENARKRGLRR